jgi:DNA-binding NarL/FixJ family response regulator
LNTQSNRHSPEDVKVLIVDDRDYLRVLIHAYLRLAFPKCRIAGVSSLDDAFKFLQNSTPRVVVAKLGLENKSGIEMAKDIKKLMPHTDIVFVADDDLEVRAQGHTSLEVIAILPLDCIHTHLIPLIAGSLRRLV